MLNFWILKIVFFFFVVLLKVILLIFVNIFLRVMVCWEWIIFFEIICVEKGVFIMGVLVFVVIEVLGMKNFWIVVFFFWVVIILIFFFDFIVLIGGVRFKIKFLDDGIIWVVGIVLLLVMVMCSEFEFVCMVVIWLICLLGFLIIKFFLFGSFKIVFKILMMRILFLLIIKGISWDWLVVFKINLMLVCVFLSLIWIIFLIWVWDICCC